MKEISLLDARKLLETNSDQQRVRVPAWFQPEYIPLLFPVDHRPGEVSVATPPTSPEGSTRTSTRRDEDETRRRAMHTLVTNWDKSARTVARQLIDLLFRGIAPPHQPTYSGLSLDETDVANVIKFASLIPDSSDFSGDLLSRLRPSPSIPRHLPVSTIGGYSVTETVGPLAMLARVCRYKEPVTVWVKDKIELSHGRRRVRIVRKEGKIVLFDRFMNLVFIPAGNPADNWHFIRGNVVALIHRIQHR